MLTITDEDRTALQHVLRIVRTKWAKCGEALNSEGREVYTESFTAQKYSLCGAIICQSPTFRDYERVRDLFRAQFGVTIFTLNDMGQQAVIDATEKLLALA